MSLSASDWPREHGGAARLGEGQSAPGQSDSVQSVEQELWVEGDLDLGAGERGLDGLARLGVVAGAGLDGDLAVGELEQHRRVALGDERDALDGLLEGRGLDDSLGVDRGREDRGDLGVLAVEQARRRLSLAGLEADEAVAAVAEGELDRARGAERLGGVGELAGRDQGDVVGIGAAGVQVSSRMARR